MKAYIQYFNRSPITGNLIEECGDRALVQLDGRQSVNTWHQAAVNCNGYRRPVYVAYQLLRGRHLIDAKPISEIVFLNGGAA